MKNIIALITACSLAAMLLAGCAGAGSFNPRPLSQQNNAGVGPMSDLRLADSALASGSTELASNLYEKALKAEPNSIEAQLGLADSTYQSGEHARVLYARAASAAPANPGPQLGLARVALRQRRLDDAAALYHTLVTEHPDSAVAAEGLGTVLDLQGHHDEAQTIYRAALHVHPEAQGLTTNLGLSLILANKPREGANVLLDIAGLANAPPQARQNLALAYALLGNTNAAKQILQADLPPASVEDNLRFYQLLRTKLAASDARLPDAQSRK
jgi:Flp pilus assembly protein TadD